MLSGISAYRFVPVDPIRRAVPVRSASVGRSENARLARNARYEAMRVQTYAPYRSVRNSRSKAIDNRVQGVNTRQYYYRRRLDTYA